MRLYYIVGVWTAGHGKKPLSSNCIDYYMFGDNRPPSFYHYLINAQQIGICNNSNILDYVVDRTSSSSRMVYGLGN